jgi:hypothetical protein
VTGVHFDTSQVDRLAVDLSEAPKRLQFAARKTMKRTALEIKRRMQEEFSGHRYAEAVPLSLEFRATRADGLGYEIGELDSAGPQWGLAAILAYGTSNNAPVADHRKSLREEAPIMLAHLGSDAADAVLGGDR